MAMHLGDRRENAPESAYRLYIIWSRCDPNLRPFDLKI